MTTLATRTDVGFVINGLKTWVTNGPVGDMFTVLCQTDPAKKLRGLNFFFVPRETPGLSVSKAFNLLGTRTTQISEVSFNNCHIAHDHRLGEEGQGTTNLLDILSEIRTMTAALAIGLARAALADSIRYARERVAFGKTINKYQMIQAKVAEMAVDIEASNLLTYKATHMIDDKIPCLKESSQWTCHLPGAPVCEYRL